MRRLFPRLWDWLAGVCRWVGERLGILSPKPPVLSFSSPIPAVLVRGKRLPLGTTQEKKPAPVVPPKKTPKPTSVPRGVSSTQRFTLPRQVSKGLPEGFELSFQNRPAELVIPSHRGTDLPVLPADLAPKTVVESRHQLEQLLSVLSEKWDKP
jgi:hypothetical protein